MRKIIFGVIFCLFTYTSAYSLEQPTHSAINEEIAQRTINEFSLNTYLLNQLGFSNGINETFSKDPEMRTVLEWLGSGGIQEDAPPLRSFRHFHDPLQPWDSAGLSNSTLGRSSVIWAQSTDQSYGNYSWQDVRNYFYSALTATNKTTREYYFAETFRGLGQLMHLVHDASVPLHTRDDAHIIFSYEGWVEQLRLNENNRFNSWIINNISFDQSILNLSPNPLAPIPIARIVDTDTYSGTNPDITASTEIGLAEYSNANFCSEDTAFTDYPYPNWNSVEQTDYVIPDPGDPSGTVFRQYYKKIRDGELGKDINGDENPDGYRVATVGFLKDYVLTYFSELAKFLRAYERPAFDAEVYGDYASLLIPRAVGYSAGLLNYFFRGNIEAVNLNSMNDVSGNVTGMKLKVKNLTPNEAMGPGKLIVSYQYKPSGSNDFVYGTSKKEVLLNETLSFNSESISEFTFTFHPSIPSNAQEIKYWLVYRGKLGSEEDAVVGKMLELKKFYGYLVDLGDPEAHINIIAKRNHYSLERYGNYITETATWPMKIGHEATLDDKYFYRSLRKDDGSVVILKSSIIDMANEEEIFFAWPTPIFEEAPNGVNSFTTDGEFFYFTYYFTDIDYTPFYKLLKYSKAGGDIIAEFDWPHIRDISSFEIKCDDSYLYIIRYLFSLSPQQFIIEVRNKSDFTLVTTIQPPRGFGIVKHLMVDKNLIYITHVDYGYPYGVPYLSSYSKDTWKLVESRFLEFLQYGRINTHDDKFFYAHNELVYPDSTTEDQYIRIDKQTFEIFVKNLGPGLLTSSWFNGLLSSYEYFISEGLDKKGYKFEYGTEE